MSRRDVVPREPSAPGNPIPLRSPLALFVPSLQCGGAETVMATVASGLARNGWEIDMVAARAEGPIAGRLDPGVNVVDLKHARIRSALPALIRYLRARRPGVLLSTLSHANMLAVAARRLARVDTAVLLRQANLASADTWALASDPISRLLGLSQRLAYRMSDGVISVSDGVTQDLRATLALPGSHITTVYNPVDIDAVRTLGDAPIQHPWLLSQELPVVLAVGRLTPAKDYPTLISAFQQVRHSHPARLIILGEGPERPRLEKMVHDLGLTGQVDLPGYAENPYAFMSRAALFVLSSKYEGMPNALIEALALGVPLVSTDCRSGPSEVLDEGRYGALVPVGAPVALARAISAKLGSPHDPAPQKQFAEARFSMPVCIGRYEEAIRSVLSGRKGRRRGGSQTAMGDE